MISKTDFKSKIAATQEAYKAQSTANNTENKGTNNLVVDGSGVGNITTQADETVILLADGDDLVFAESDWNQIEAQAGDNKIKVVGGENTVLTDNGNNTINVTGNVNYIHTTNGNNNINLKGEASTITTKNGDNDILSIGAYNVIDTQDGNNSITSIGSFNKISATGASKQNKINSFGDKNEIIASGRENYISSGGSDNLIIAKDGTNQIISGAYRHNEDNTFSIVEDAEGGNNNVIYGGSGNDTIYSMGSGNRIFGRDGNDEIHSRGDGNRILGGNGNDTIYSTGKYNYVDGQDGNDHIVSAGDKNRILGGRGKDDIYSTGNSNVVDGGLGYDTIQSFGDKNKLYGGDDKDGNTMLSIGKQNYIEGSNGNDWILSIGDKNNIAAKDGNNNIVFNGNHINISAGDGNNTIETLDFAIMKNKTFDYGKYADYLEDQTTVEHYSELVSSTKETKEIGRKYGKAVSTEIKNLTADSIIKQLPAAEQKLAQGIDFSAVTKDGKPQYVICRAQKDGKLHIYKNESGNTYRAIGPNVSTSGDYRLQLSDQQTQVIGSSKQKTTQQITVVYQDVITNKYQDYEKTTIRGNEDIHVTIGKGSNNILLNASKDVTIDGKSVQLDENGEYVNDKDSFNNIFVTGSIVSTTKDGAIREEHLYQNKKETTFEKTYETSTGKTITATTTNAKTYDPLVVDFNRNGVVSASSMTGVDINGDGIADGAASNGDKMLAMSDMNGNGVIDGSEIFGNQTVSPFTGEVLDAKNGFEALKLIAQEAQEHTGINCINDGNVDLAELQRALQRVGKNLGFISDDNVTNLEGLGHVASINVDDYSEINDNGDAQFRQTGHYTDNKGNQYQAGDFWFKEKKV